MSDLVLLALLVIGELVIGEAASQPFEAQLGFCYVALNRLSLCSSCSLWDVVVESGEFASINAAWRLPESYVGRYWHEPEKLSKKQKQAASHSSQQRRLCFSGQRATLREEQRILRTSLLGSPVG
jgi:hypothetical protein